MNTTEYEKIIDLFQRAGIKEYLHVNYENHYEIVAQSKNAKAPVAFSITDGKITSIMVWDAYDSLEDAIFGIGETIVFADDLEKVTSVDLCKVPERYTFPKQEPAETPKQDKDSKINVDDTMLDIDTEDFDSEE